jgi:dynein heavy chain
MQQSRMFGSQSFDSSMIDEGERSIVKPTNASWSRSAPFEKDLFKYNISDKIGSHLTPSAANLSSTTVRHPNRKLPVVGRASPIPPPRPESSLSMIQSEVSIASAGPRQSSPPTDSTEMNEEEMERYYGYILNGMDGADIAPIEREWLHAVMSSLPERLANTAESDAELVDRLATEIESDYLVSMRKSVVDYVLSRPAEKERLGVGRLPPTEAEKVARPPIDSAAWRPALAESREALHAALHVTNPAMVQALDAWQQYAGLSLVADAAGHLAMEGAGIPCELETFREVQTAHRERIKKTLKDVWFEDVAERFRGCQSALPHGAALDTFFESAAVLMGNQLREIVTRSVDQMVAFFKQYQVAPDQSQGAITAAEAMEQEEEIFSGTLESKLPMPCAIIVSLVYEGGAVEISPTMVEVEQQVLDIFEKSVQCLSDMERVESKLLSSPSNGILYLPCVHLEEDWVEAARHELLAAIRSNFAAPQALAEQYTEFDWLLNGEAEKTVETLLSKPRQLSDYEEAIAKLRTAADAIEAQVGFSGDMQACRLTLIEVHCVELNEYIGNKANSLADKILEQMAIDNRKYNDKICQQFVAIRKQLREVPEDTEALVNFIAQAEIFKRDDVPKLKNDAIRSRITLEFLLKNHHILQDDDRALVAQTFTWVDRIMPEFDKTEEKLRDDRDAFEEDLKQRMETFLASMAAIKEEVMELKNVGGMDSKTMKNMVEACADIRQRLDEGLEVGYAMNEEEEHLGWMKTVFQDILDAGEALQPLTKLWNAAWDFTQSRTQWEGGPFRKLRAEPIIGEVDQYLRDMKSLSRGFKSDNAEEPLNVAQGITEKLKEFQEKIPLIEYLCHPGLRDRHWEQLAEIVGYSIKPDEFTTLNSVVGQRLDDFMPKFEEISFAASKEHNLEKSLDTMLMEWQDIELPFGQYRDTEWSIMGNLEEIQMQLDDHIVKTQTMKSNSFIGPFEERTKKWESSLLKIQDVLDLWLAVQVTWMYLEPIFSSEDIMKQMPLEGKMFKTVDGNWKKLITAAVKNTQTLAVIKIPDILELLKEANDMLDVIQKGLNDYLETKRIFFARFFFLSNEELLEILSETKDPTRVQPHLKKCFEGLQSLDMGDTSNLDKIEITGMMDRGKELVEFTQPVKPAEARGSVEKWLLQVENAMKASVKSVVLKSIPNYTECPRTEFVLAWAGQAVLATTGLYWTIETEKAIEEGGAKGIKGYADTCTQQLNDIVQLVRGKLTKTQRSILGALVTLDVHARDVLLDLAEKGVEDKNDFEWTSQLRYAIESGNGGVKGMGDDEQMKCKMINAVLNYGYEYLGNSFRLVVTPLTDRCYRTLMGALHLHFGGAPEGPAGTGKTETTKDLAKAIAKQCVVFNCSDGLDYIAMGKFFKGLGASGAWACFDEFNRIDLEVLSVVAQQLLCIIRAITAKLEQFDFEGTLLPLDPTCCPFITMNPGYAGRSELPDNLKVLFRTVAMMVPNYTMIAQIQLMSCGYMDAAAMAVKITTTYKLCSEQLSSQGHYDYGMRAVKAVLTASANLKQRYPEEDESILVLRSIRDVNLCKFLSFDVPLFNGIIRDLFPGTVLPEADYVNLNVALINQTKIHGLQFTDVFQTKVIQLYEMICVRHGLMVVGRPFGAKTSMLRVLSESLTELHSKGQNGENVTELLTLNPKSVKMTQLYGVADPVSQEWQDGVLSNTFRTAANRTDDNRKWVILDGPVDAIWIENMNTVLDDNKKLCLNSGEIVQMSGTMNMIFEVRDLAVASPATVSRCGMVYVEPEEMGWDCVVASWLEYRPEFMPEEQKATLKGLADWLLPAALDFQRRNCKEPSPTIDQTLLVSAFRIMECLHDVFLAEETASELDTKQASALIETSFLFGVVWSIGCSVDTEGRAKFDEFFRELISGKHRDWSPPPGMKLQYLIPDKGTIYDYVFDTENGKWQPWTDRIENKPVIDKDAKFSEIIVPTVDTCRYAYLLEILQCHNFPVLFVGPTGTGKSVYTVTKLTAKMPEEYGTMTVTFSAQTTANQTQDIIDGKLDKRRKGIFGPPMGKKMIIFVDDLNMPMVEEYGAQPPIEILRQYMDHKGWYDRKETTFRSLVDIQFVAAMGPPGGGRSFVTERYLRHFNHISVTEFDDATMIRIFEVLQNWYFTTANSFSADVAKLTPKLVKATLSVYQAVMKEMLPTPTKSHYTFNLRDFARVMGGICISKPDQINSPEKCIRLWIHEVYRVFFDRLTNEKDQTWFYEHTKKALETDFGKNMDKLFTHLDADGNGMIDMEEMNQMMFGNYSNPDKRVYDEITDLEAIQTTVEEYLSDYNSVSKTPMPLVLFNFCIQHVSKISRVLSMEGGNALLVGVGGSGRQSLTRLAAHVQECEVFQIEISKNYAYTDWLEDLKKVLMSAGAKGMPTVFLFTDSQIQEESYVEDINNLLNAGEVPNLWANDEKAIIMEAVATQAKQNGRKIGNSMADHLAYFVELCRKNLHVVLAFSPIGDAFRTRLRMFPSLINCCTIDWFQDWPEEGLTAVAKRALADLTLDEEVKSSCVVMCKHFHASIKQLSTKFFSTLQRTVYTTPTSYLELIGAFKTLLNVKKNEVATKKARYENGLVAIKTTEASVDGMKTELIELQPKLVVAQQETAEMMVVIERETEDANKVKAVVEKEEAAANETAMEVKAVKDECEADLAEAIPVLNAAVKALDTLKKSDTDEVKNMGKPPAGVRLTMAAVLTMKGVKPQMVDDPDKIGKKKPDFWEPAKKVLADPKFLQSLKDFDKDNIPPKIIEAIRTKYITDETFVPEIIKKASLAAEGLCKWVRAIESYDRVAKMVAPKKALLAKSEGQYAEVMKALSVKQAQLKEVLDKLAGLQATFDGLKQKQADLEAQVDMCEKKLDRAEKLIVSLGGEKARWTDSATELGVKLNNVTGDVLIAAGMVAYVGPFTKMFREEITADWIQTAGEMNVPRSEIFSLIATLGEPVQIREWNIQGLPSDDFSTENGIIVDIGRRWPLMIDPQEQGNKWVRNMEAANKLTRVKLTGDYLRTLENSIQFGTPVLLEDIAEALDPSLEPLLLKQVFKQGGVNCMRLGDATIEYSDDFRFYISTKLRNPHYAPETAVKVSLVNFMITPEGLEDQILGTVVAMERPDLQEQKEALVLEGAANARKLKEIEDKILEILSGEGNILDDESGIQVLSSSKVVANEIEAKQEAGAETEKTIDTARESYRPIAFHASILFFNISDLCIIDPMYQYSLDWYNATFKKGIADSKPNSDVPTRLKILEDFFTYSLYCNVCRSLFEKDKLLFSFTMCVAIRDGAKQMNMEEYGFLLTGGVSLSANTQRNPGKGWLDDDRWDQICRLGDLPAYDGINTGFAAQLNEWKAIYDSDAPHQADLPGQWNTKLSLFQKILVLRCIRPDKCVPAIQAYVAAEMGQQFVESPPFDLGECYADSIAIAPLIFVLSPGSDPMAALLKFADDKKMGGDKLQTISLGQGQGPRAFQLLKAAREQGTWVVLQNCHLAKSFMPGYETLVEGMTAENCHSEFRMWCTSYPSPIFPVALLQNGVKMTQEPPKGIKANLMRSYLSDPVSDEAFYADIDQGKTLEWHKMLFGLCFFHSLIQERRAFGPLGWNIPYGFNESDQRISIQQLQMFLNEYEETPYTALTYTAGQCNYGGRVTDDHDRRVLISYLDLFYTEDILAEGYTFSTEEAAKMYCAPPLGRIDSIVDYITSLPLEQPPEIFGLHSNANLTKDQNETNLLFTSIISTRSGGGGGGEEGGKSFDELVEEVADGILSQLPPDFNLELASKKYPTDPMESMNTVLTQELIRYIRLTSTIRKSLQQLKQAIKGFVVMSAELDAVANSLSVGFVPSMWMGVSYPNLKPLGGYVADLLLRLEFFKGWIDNGTPNIFWFSGFFFQPSFLTGALQNFARKYVIPIDSCQVEYIFQSCSMSEREWKKPEDGVYVYGLYMEGARFNREKMLMDESFPKTLFDEMPVGLIRPCEKKDLSVYPNYECPLYKTLDRRGVLATSGHSTNFVMEVRVPSDKKETHWINRGVAMFCALAS